MTLKDIPVETDVYIRFKHHTEGLMSARLRFKTRTSGMLVLRTYAGVSIEAPLSAKVETDSEDSSYFEVILA